VIKVEPPAGDPLRRWSCGGGRADGVDGALFRYLHHGHRSVVDDPDVREEDADVLITDGEGARAAADAHPGLVVVAITTYGLTGPYAGRPASELTVQADAGAVAIRGRPDRPPIQAGGQVTDWVTGVYAAVATLAALRAGRGELIDVSWAEVANLTCTNFVDLADSMRGRPDLRDLPPARSFETPSIEPTLDGYVGFNTNTRQQFESFCLLIERPDLMVSDPSWAMFATRSQRWDEWNRIVHEWTTRHTTAEIVEQAALLRIPVSPVLDGRGVLDVEQAVARGVFVDDPTGSFRMPRRPWAIDGEPSPLPRPAPGLGEHTGQVGRRTRRPAPGHPVVTGAPLEGVLVVDLTAWWAGPSATGVLAALGATVVHVESASRPDGMRMTGALLGLEGQWWERSTFFLQANANKLGITIDLPAGRALLLELIARADVVIENYTPRVLEAFDLGWDVVHAANPRAVMVRMPAFGLDGPWRDRPGFAQTMEQVTGLAWMTGYVDDQPRIQRGPCDPNGGMHAAFAALVALDRRDRTGVGCFVEATMFEAALNIAAEPVLEWTAYGNLLGRDGNRSPRAAPQGLYPCRGREEWLALSVLEDAQWRALVGVLGQAAWADDPGLATAAGRRARHDEIDARISAWASIRPLETCVAVLLGAGVPAAPATDPRRTAEHPQFVARRYSEVVDHPVVGAHPVPTVPFRLRSVERWIRTPAPTLGQHNTEVLGGWLGRTDAQLDELRHAGVIGDRPVL
jgi:crotonobetainyl-CoA:carnitine CoA-transferase CaiB-like acyl-CoA transferase